MPPIYDNDEPTSTIGPYIKLAWGPALAIVTFAMSTRRPNENHRQHDVTLSKLV